MSLTRDASPAASDPSLAAADTALTVRNPAAPEADSDRARRLLVPVADPSGAATPSTVTPVLPGRPSAARPEVRIVTAEPGDAGGPPCPWCGTPNHPDRHFCVRCAMPTAANDQRRVGPAPWWRRLLNFQGGEAPWAGERPRLRRTFWHVIRWIVMALVLILLIVLAFQIPDAVRATRDHFVRRAPVQPDSFHVSQSFPGHPPRLAFDKLNDSWWGPGVNNAAEGEWIEARFDQPTRLLDVIITPGVSTRPDELGTSALPHRIEARITNADGETTTRQLTLDQGVGGQRRAFRAEDVTRVRFTLVSAHVAAPDRQVAIAEIEFFGPTNANRL